jgi:hypothetical protein
VGGDELIELSSLWVGGCPSVDIAPGHGIIRTAYLEHYFGARALQEVNYNAEIISRPEADIYFAASSKDPVAYEHTVRFRDRE